MNLSGERRRALTAKARSLAGNVEQALPYLMSRGISAEVAEMFQLGYSPHGTEQGGRLAIPYYTPAGVTNIKYRCIDLDHGAHGDHKGHSCPKYIYEAGLGHRLYNAQVLIDTGDSVVLTEGELDAVCVQAYCGIPAVAYPGCDTWSKERHWPLCFEGIAEVIVVCDGDKVGREAAGRVAKSMGMKARVIDMPSGEDANSFIHENGAGAFLERIAA
jgi:DNA primase